MKTFPGYSRDVHIDIPKRCLKVHVTARTRCGQDIEGVYAVTLAGTDAKSTGAATLRATSFAVSELKRAHAAVVAACVKQGKHGGHNP